jgi:hypothetical protein
MIRHEIPRHPDGSRRRGKRQAVPYQLRRTHQVSSRGVWIISPEGKHLGAIKVPETVSNVAWGDKDSKTLYIMASTSVYRIKLRVPGVKP